MGFLKKLTGVDLNNNQPEMENNLDTNLDMSFEMDEDTVFDLPIDVYEDEDNVYLRAFIPGVRPTDIDIEITREVVNITGERVETEKIDSDKYYQRELVWGKFEKKVLLPHEIDVDRVKASTTHGMITLKMPKLDKDRSVKVNLD